MAQKLMFQEINATQIKAKFQYYEGIPTQRNGGKRL